MGGAWQVGSIVMALVLAWLVRGRRPSFGWTLAGALGLLGGFGLWLSVIAPVNAEVEKALAAAPASVPELWMQLRTRWEYGHMAGFIAQLAGFAGLLVSVLVETPADAASKGSNTDAAKTHRY